METLAIIGPVTDRMIAALQAKFALIHCDDLDDPIGWLADHGADIRYVLTNGHDGLPAAYWDHLPNLALISNYGVGYDAIDTEMALKRGVMVTHTPDVLNAEVATTAVLLMLAAFRELAFNENHLRSGAWARDGNAPLSRSADHRTIAILGMGRIGQEIARKLAPFNPRILYHTRTPKDVPYTYVDNLVDMASAADVLIIITPGGPSTQHLVNSEVLHALGPDGILVNVARGSVVDQDALITALQSGALGWAALDVFADEPHVPQVLCNMPNTVLTPHIGSGTIQTRRAMGDLAIENLMRHLSDGQVSTPVPECAKSI